MKIPARYGKATKLKKGDSIKVCKGKEIWEKPDHSDSTSSAPRQICSELLKGCYVPPPFPGEQALLLQVINDKGTQVVDTWAFNADDLKVGLRPMQRK